MPRPVRKTKTRRIRRAVPATPTRAAVSAPATLSPVEERQLARKNLRLMLMLAGLVTAVTLGGLAFFVLLYLLNQPIPSIWPG